MTKFELLQKVVDNKNRILSPQEAYDRFQEVTSGITQHVLNNQPEPWAIDIERYKPIEDMLLKAGFRIGYVGKDIMNIYVTTNR